jgi:uncharacterized protein (DUF1800 family)
MKTAFKLFSTITVVVISSVLFSFNDHTDKTRIHFPYKQAGLTERQAAAHLLSRFTFGAKPTDVDAVVKMGLEKWFRQQLKGDLPDDTLNQILSGYDALKLTNTEVVNTYPNGGQVLRMAVRDGVIKQDSVSKADRKEYRDQLEAYMQQKGLKPQQELQRQFVNQKILRATYSNNQLRELLTDFWFNHFNVSVTKNDCAEFIPAYERDVIRPNVFGKFQDLLLATAKSPAMLMYLDNFTSAGANSNQNNPINGQLRKKFAAQLQQMGDSMQMQRQVLNKLQQAKKNQGLNENYAREVMELHTLGVDGGYTQQDVTQAARILTGWTVYPMGNYGYGGAMKNIIDKIGEDNLKERGFVHDGDFLFAINRHDMGEKVVLGKNFPANGGYEEGVELLTMLAHHPSTARFITRKIAVRFVSDNPPQSLLDKMAKTFTEKDGDISQVLITMVSSPEFWSKESLREKTKSPFELAISSARSLDADIKAPFQLYNWITKMGQKLYFYQAPTGFPDKGQYWINTGALLNRMNFGLALASNRIPGVRVDLAALNNHHEPESSDAALITYGKLILPERNLDETVKRLTPLLNDPNLVKKVDDAAGKTAAPQQANAMQSNDMTMKDDVMLNNKNEGKVRLNKGGGKNDSLAALQGAQGNNSMLSQVVGIIIGSPEFQRK